MITTLNTYEDGTLLGADEKGNLYIGTPVAVGHHQLTVETVIADDGKSYERTTSYGGEVHGFSSVTEEGFNEVNRKIKGLSEEECAALWEAEKAITSHKEATGVAYNTIDWELK